MSTTYPYGSAEAQTARSLIGGTAIGDTRNELLKQILVATANKTSGGGGVAWGAITGTLDDQTDLAAALAAKLDKAGGTMTGALTLNLGGLLTAGLTHQQTWNSGGTVCRGVEIKITDTASSSVSTAFRVCTGAAGTTERFAVQTDGTVQISGSAQVGSNCISQYLYSRAGYIALGASDNAVLQWIAADTIGMKRSTNAQKFRVFGDGTKYAQLEHDGTNAKLTASGGNVHISNLPTSNPGPGILWNNAGTPAIGT